MLGCTAAGSALQHPPRPVCERDIHRSGEKYLSQAPHIHQVLDSMSSEGLKFLAIESIYLSLSHQLSDPLDIPVLEHIALDLYKVSGYQKA